MIKFNKYNVTNGKVKAKIHYCVDNHISNKPCITLYAKDYSRSLGIIFPNDYINDTDSQTDYFDEGLVRLFEDHPLYKEARKKATEKPKQKSISVNSEFDKALKLFVTIYQDKLDSIYSDSSMNPQINITKGTKYLKLAKVDYPDSSGSIKCFIDIKTGLIHKAKNWRSPYAACDSIFNFKNNFRFG